MNEKRNVETYREQKCRTAPYVVGPDGSPLTLTDLPLPDTRRWTIARKAQVW